MGCDGSESGFSRANTLGTDEDERESSVKAIGNTVFVKQLPSSFEDGNTEG